MQGLLGETSTDETGVHAADDFDAFFKDKVETVRRAIAATPAYKVPSWTTMSMLQEWTPVTVREVEKLIASALNKTCQLARSSTDLVSEGNAWTSGAFHCLAVQQVACHRMLSS